MSAGSDLLSSGFSTADPSAWQTSAAKAGALDRPPRSDDGIPVGPIYERRVDAVPVVDGSAGRPWLVVQRISATDADAAGAALLEEFTGGADGVMLAFSDSLHPLGGHIPAEAAPVIASKVPSSIPAKSRIMFDAGCASAEISASLLTTNVYNRFTLVLMWDPLAALAASRITIEDLAGRASSAANLIKVLDERGLEGQVACADGRLWHAAGASEAQELAAALATVVALLRSFEVAGVALDRAAARIGVALAADSDQFLTIAKFRAMRLLLARVLEESGLDAAIPVHAETAWRMMSRREPRMNVLRATGAALAAAVGGADSITVLPYDALDGPSSAAALRLARNTQLIAAQESQIFRFADPAAGSGAIEALTDGLAEKAWDRFRAIEAAGGLLTEGALGALCEEVAATSVARLARVADGEIEMVGVNVFRAPDAEPLAPAGPAASEGALAYHRLSETVEALP